MSNTTAVPGGANAVAANISAAAAAVAGPVLPSGDIALHRADVVNSEGEYMIYNVVYSIHMFNCESEYILHTNIVNSESEYMTMLIVGHTSASSANSASSASSANS